MAAVTDGMDAEHTAALGRRYLISSRKTPCGCGRCGSG